MKSIYKSKVFWVNIVTIVVAVGAAFGVTPNEELATNIAGILIGISPAVNIVLRFFTKDEVTL